MRLRFSLLAALVASLAPAPSLVSAERSDVPHIVLILADDLGWGDPRCYHPESRIPTPGMDRLAATGMRFTDAHTPSSVCTPTRYTLLTGRYCWRTSLAKGVLDGFGPPLIEPEESTLASLLASAGYRTACVGKWHLGMQWHDAEGSPVGRRGPRRFRPGTGIDYGRDVFGGPLDVGFERFFGISASLDMAPYAYLVDRRIEALPTEWHEEIEDTLFLNGVSGVRQPGFRVHDVLPRLGDEAVSVVDSHDPEAAPLFLYLPLTSPHLPVAPSESARGKSDAGLYGDFVWETDHIVGRVLDALEAKSMRDDTLVLFTSDNGGLWHGWSFSADDDGGEPPMTPRARYTADFGHHSNAHWRGTKADIYEGGHRVPFLVSWPARVEAGQVCDALVELTDVYATVAELLGESIGETGSGMDSLSFLHLLDDPSGTGRPFAVHHSLRGWFALREDDWKLIEGRGSGGFTRPRTLPVEPGGPEGQLYDLGEDPQETRNRWLAEPDRVTSMKARLERIRSTSGRAEAALSGTTR